MLETVFKARNMEFVPQMAEPAARLHLLVVDADAAMRSACAEIAVEPGLCGGDHCGPAQARSLLRGHAADILLVNLPGGQPGPGAGRRGQDALSADVGDRDDRLRLGEHRGRGHALRRLRLPDQALRDGRASTVLDRAASRHVTDTATRQLRERLRLRRGWAR